MCNFLGLLILLCSVSIAGPIGVQKGYLEAQMYRCMPGRGPSTKDLPLVYRDTAFFCCLEVVAFSSSFNH